MGKFVAALAFVAFATTAHADPLVLAKTYDCVGSNPDGSKYTGSVSVNVLSDTTFAIRWDISGIFLYCSRYLFLFRSQVITFINYNILYCCMDFGEDSGLATFPSGPFPYLYNFLLLIFSPEE